jgi:hypothetical protein
MPRVSGSSSGSGCAAVVVHDVKGEVKKIKTIIEAVTTS